MKSLSKDGTTTTGEACFSQAHGSASTRVDEQGRRREAVRSVEPVWPVAVPWGMVV